MSGWIRVGRDHPWHRVSEFEYDDAIQRGEYRLLCGQRLATAGGWQDAVSSEVPPDDQHPPCRDRALREAYWRGRIQPGELTEIVGALVAEADPALDGATIFPTQRVGGLSVWIAKSGDASILGAGGSPADAIGDLLANVEARAAQA